MKIRNTHYEKAANELIYAVKNVVDFKETPLKKLDWRKGKKVIIEMLKANFISKKSKWI